METDVPHLLTNLNLSSCAYKQYFDKLIALRGSGQKNVDPLELVRPDSPTWRKLKKAHASPTTLKARIEGSLAKEIPETTETVRKANMIPTPMPVNKV